MFFVNLTCNSILVSTLFVLVFTQIQHKNISTRGGETSGAVENGVR